LAFVSILNYAHQLISQSIQQDDIVIDATMGNGNDTLFLRELVGVHGKVYGFDIQQKALEKTSERVTEKFDDASNVVFFQQTHADMLKCIPQINHGSVSAIMFNLGYLPGSDHSLVTRAESTLLALEAALYLLIKGGLITIIIYPGHPGGHEEADQVRAWANQLPQNSFQVLLYQFLNQRNDPPFLIAVRKS
jgi:predicted methyltransferase